MKVFMGPVICADFAGARFVSMNGPEKDFSRLKKFLPTFIPSAWKAWEGMESGFIGATGIILGFTRFNICAKSARAEIVFRVPKKLLLA